MADFTYPASLKNPRMGDFKEEALGGEAEDPNDFGVYNSRNLTTKILRRWEYAVELDDTDRATLLDFYDTDVVRSEIFDWTHPLTAEVIEVKFQARPAISTNGYDWHIGQVRIIEV